MNTIPVTANPAELDRLRSEVSRGELDFETSRLLHGLIPGWDAGVVAEDQDFEEQVLLNRLLLEVVPADVQVGLAGQRVTLYAHFRTTRVAGWVEGEEAAMRDKLSGMLEKLTARRAGIPE